MKGPFANLKHALQNWKMQSVFAAIWCGLISGGVALSLHAQGWHLDANFLYAIAPFAIASAMAAYLTMVLAETFVLEKPAMARFSFFFAALCISTIGLTAFIFAVHFRLTVSQWSAPFLSLEWIERTFFTMMTATYLFAVTGFRLLMPWGIVALSVASIGFSRGWFQPSR